MSAMQQQVQQQLEVYLDVAQKYAKENPVVVYASAAAGVLVFGSLLLPRASMKRDGSDFQGVTAATKMLHNADSVLSKDKVHGSIAEYEDLFSGARKNVGTITNAESVESRKERYQTMIDHFYNLVTDFYEWGWGQSFHFGPRWKGETFMESIKRTEYHLCSRLHMTPRTKALDVGCGVGGPMRNMAIFSGADITGITLNQYQVKIGNKYCEQQGLGDRCRLVQGDFQNLPFPDETFDVAFAIEATCHSPDRVKCFSGIARTLKAGGHFAGYEWIVTDKYNPADADHVRIKEGIEVGNGLPTLATAEEIQASLEAAGFELVEAYDANAGVHSPHQIPWYQTLSGSYSLSGFRMTFIGRNVTHAMVTLLELFGIAPKGSVRVSALLNATALDLVEGGKKEIFTPSYFFIARKK